MTEEQQIQLREMYNPEGSDLRKLQLKLVQMLEYFDRFCRMHDLKYWLAFGTCLGAVRHKGFIPWDDDVDVMMFQDDYDKLLACFEEDDDYAIQSLESDLHYLMGYAKLRDKHSIVNEDGPNEEKCRFHGCFIDIFPYGYDHTSNFVNQQVKQHGIWLSHLNRKEHLSPARLVLFKFLKKLYCMEIRCLQQRSMKHRIESVRMGAGSSFYKRILDSRFFDGCEMAEFEGLMLPVPNDCDMYLRKIYGDYMSIPDPQNRAVPHFRIRYLE